VEHQLRDAVERGGQVVAGGHRVDPASNVLRPTVLVDVPGPSAVLEEETFGPLLPLVRVKDADEAVRRANDTQYGLSASIWTGDRRRGMKLGKRLKVGGVTVNDALVHYGIASLPFGGVRESGFGRARGMEGLGELTRTHGTVTDRLGLEREPWWFPYSKATEMLLWATLLFRWKGGIRGVLSAAVALLKRRRG
jgi:betaine-aldehyde dehydrogenase